MSDVLLFSSIMMLVLLFLKVPVFVAVLGGSLVYFIMNPDINSVIFAQQMILGTEKSPCWRFRSSSVPVSS